MKPLSIADIKSELNEINIKREKGKFEPERMDLFISKYKDDTRSGVLKLVESARKKIVAYEDESKRVDFMLTYEREAYLKNASFVAGIDEAGRGPLAGPVVAAAVILNPDDPILYVNDSKKLSEKMREQLYEEIIERAVSYGIGIVQEKDIDEMNILNATYKAMTIAVKSMNKQADYLLNDAVIIPKIDLPQEKIIKGDAKSLSIAAASILAKVTRDRIMVSYDELYPDYGFSSNKGYGSAQHIESIKSKGICPIHRLSFVKNFIN